MSSKQSITIQQRVFEVAVDAASFRLANRGPVLFDVVGSRRGQVPRMNRLLVLLSAQDGERSLSLTVVLMVMARWGARRELADSGRFAESSWNGDAVAFWDIGVVLFLAVRGAIRSPLVMR